jgi:hypothetical protein
VDKARMWKDVGETRGAVTLVLVLMVHENKGGLCAWKMVRNIYGITKVYIPVKKSLVRPRSLGQNERVLLAYNLNLLTEV